jgi:hypothetical protein
MSWPFGLRPTPPRVSPCVHRTGSLLASDCCVHRGRSWSTHYRCDELTIIGALTPRRTGALTPRFPLQPLKSWVRCGERAHVWQWTGLAAAVNAYARHRACSTQQEYHHAVSRLSQLPHASSQRPPLACARNLSQVWRVTAPAPSNGQHPPPDRGLRAPQNQWCGYRLGGDHAISVRPSRLRE